MPKNKQSNSPTKAGFIVTFLLGAGMVAALAAYVKTAHADKVPQLEHIGSDEQPVKTGPDTTVRKRSSRQSDEGQDVYLYLPTWHKEELRFKKQKLSIPDGEDPKVYVVNQFLAESKLADSSARLLSVDVNHGVASLSFNDAMNQTHGTEDEMALIGGLRSCMGQFSDIEKIELFANGKPIETFGNVELADGLTVIRPGGAESSKPSEKPAP
jgi:hypothetical protein